MRGVHLLHGITQAQCDEFEAADETPFEGIRYIDRFLMRDGRIVDQKVWNDLAVAIVARQVPQR